MSKNVGKFVWYDVMTSDTKAAESFYRSVIGWDAKDSGKTDRSYTLFSAGPAMVGGLMLIPEEARAMGTRPRWTPRRAMAIPPVEPFGSTRTPPDRLPAQRCRRHPSPGRPRFPHSTQSTPVRPDR